MTFGFREKRCRKNLPLAARDMTEVVVPIETPVGTINGRNGIYLDSIAYALSPDAITLTGELNSTACSDPPESGRWIPYTVKFNSVVYLQISELDLDARELAHQSSFDTVEDSLLVASLRTNDHDNKISPEHKHFSFCTYDRIFEIISAGFNLEIGQPRPV